jgi:hypothetical protein
MQSSDACKAHATAHPMDAVITETNRIHLVLFGMQNRTLGPYSAAINRIFISVMPSTGRPLPNPIKVHPQSSTISTRAAPDTSHWFRRKATLLAGCGHGRGPPRRDLLVLPARSQGRCLGRGAHLLPAAARRRRHRNVAVDRRQRLPRCWACKLHRHGRPAARARLAWEQPGRAQQRAQQRLCREASLCKDQTPAMRKPLVALYTPPPGGARRLGAGPVAHNPLLKCGSYGWLPNRVLISYCSCLSKDFSFQRIARSTTIQDQD